MDSRGDHFTFTFPSNRIFSTLKQSQQLQSRSSSAEAVIHPHHASSKCFCLPNLQQAIQSLFDNAAPFGSASPCKRVQVLEVPCCVQAENESSKAYAKASFCKRTASFHLFFVCTDHVRVLCHEGALDQGSRTRTC